MYRISTLNAISDIIFDAMPKEQYQVDQNLESPEAVLVRSADMHGYALEDNLLAIARAGAGYNNIPVDDCAQKGIVVFNTPGANANAVKELAIAGMLLASRNIVGGINWCAGLKGKGAEVPKLVEKGKGQFAGPEIKGKTLGVVGLGAIGALVANAGQALRMNVIGYDPFISVEHAWMLSRAVKRSQSLEDLLAESDYVSIHVPLMDQTRGSFHKEVFARMKPGAVLLNFSRAELVNNSDMLEALDSGKLRAYVTDFPTDEVVGHPSIIAIPHLGASTPESEENCAQMASEQIAEYLETGSIKNSVNYPDCSLSAPAVSRIAVLHANTQGTIGALTSILASGGLNIDSMVNKSRGQYAYSVFDLDESPDPSILEKMAALDSIYKVRKIK